MSATKEAYGDWAGGGSGRGVWRDASSSRRCPVCHGSSYCQIHRTDPVVLCKRVANDNERRNRDGVPFWIHYLDDSSAWRPDHTGPTETLNADRAPPDVLNAVYRVLLADLTLSESHHAALLTRGLEPKDIEAGRYRTLPIEGRAHIAKRLVERVGELAALSIPGLYIKQKGDRSWWTLAGAAGLVIPVINRDEQIVALKVRCDDNRDDRYSYISSSKHGGACAAQAVHLPPGTYDRTTVRIIEGELKAHVCTVRTGVFTIAVPGANNWREAPETVRALGATTVLVAYDQDVKPRTRRLVKGYRDDLVRALTNVFEPDRIGVETWPINAGKGLDDVLASGRLADVKTEWATTTHEVRDESQSVASVRSQFHPAPATVSLSESETLTREGIGSVNNTPLVLQATVGAGKTRHAREHAIERSTAETDNRTVILCPTHKLVDEQAAILDAGGIPFRRARGIDSVKHVDGSPVCSRMPEVNACHDRDIPPRAAICNRAYRGLSLGSPCEHRSTCAAADPFEGPTDAKIILGTHAMAMLVLEEYPDAIAYVDESPDTDPTHVDLTPKKLRAAMKIASGLELKTLTARVELAMGMLVHHLVSETDDFESAKRSWLETPDGREVAHRHFILNGSRGTFSAAFELELAIRDLTNPDHKLHDAPLIPRRGRPIMGAPEAWQTLDTVVALFSGRATHTERSGQTLTVTVPSPVWKALAEHPRLAILDATPNVDKLTALLGRPLRVVRIDVAETAIVRRVIIPKRDLTRRALCPDHKVDPRNPRLRGAVRDVVSVILESAPKGSAGVIGSYQPVCTALKAAWETQSGALYELLKPLREQGYQVRFTFDRARDTKGVNEHDDCHFIGFIGNPLSNLLDASRTHKRFGGTAETFNAAWRNAAAQWLTQFVNRLRPVHRTGERLTMVLVGTVLPSDGWYEGNTEVVQRGSGRPATDTTNVSDQVQVLVAFHGSKRATAKAIGCDEAWVRKMEKGEPVSEHLAAKVQTALQSAELIRVQKKKKDAHSVPHFNPHPNANVSDDLPADAFDAWAPPARSRSFPVPQSTAHRRESG